MSESRKGVDVDAIKRCIAVVHNASSPRKLKTSATMLNLQSDVDEADLQLAGLLELYAGALRMLECKENEISNLRKPRP
jgi:hypothetical protein